MVKHGEVVVTTAGARVKVSGTSFRARKIIFQAKAGITGSVFIGDSTVSSTSFGIALTAGQVSPVIDCDDPSAIYMDATNNGSGATWLAVG